ncbi:MAG: hypothetical protein HYS08_00865 [Chlamydiae bacterium]|nr:hypothetical protein [Chlamydiota bacterium]MBI3265659.1 hypothetical protein [Chlamydiota bacterium]
MFVKQMMALKSECVLMCRRILCLVLLLAAFCRTLSWGQTHSIEKSRETVILLHGILNRPIIMARIERALEREGYEVINWGYPSRQGTIEEHAAALNKFIKTLDNRQTLHFVGFSLGSIIIRYYLTHYSIKNMGRFVMIAPPNHGSERVDRLYQYQWFRWLYGTKSVWQLRASNTDFFKECGIPPVEFGIIAGSRENRIGRSRIFPGDNDGTVSVESTCLPEAKDMLKLNYPHTLLVFASETKDYVVNFLKSGRFQK